MVYTWSKWLVHGPCGSYVTKEAHSWLICDWSVSCVTKEDNSWPMWFICDLSGPYMARTCLKHDPSGSHVAHMWHRWHIHDSYVTQVAHAWPIHGSYMAHMWPKWPMHGSYMTQVAHTYKNLPTITMFYPLKNDVVLLIHLWLPLKLWNVCSHVHYCSYKQSLRSLSVYLSSVRQLDMSPSNHKA